ncbi:CPBP family glutamic-type intramembrane protease [Azohydromonas caseinilytica]|uniref:CPBP family intramembrane metalloprotease n=1 Tax=Azohydromonas caseinilytica TaxID=2728836 RepID=A0A848FBP0_9BURK|nr:CPBP family glutamic-type intramembrane protease [Azohydromonas caseinilytica]NML17617.1 CPBP family intramembrane metalloprotease [Azohydromonas caseinilytica]
MTDPRPATAAVAPSFLTRWKRALLLGMPGVLVLPLQWARLPVEALPPPLQEMGPVVRALLSMVNPLLILLVLAAVGAAVAHRAGLRSVWVQRVAGADAGPAASARLRAQLLQAVLIGLALAVLLYGADRLLLPRLGAPGAALLAQQAATDASAALTGLALGLLYGGFTEEVMLRWGVMSLVVWFIGALLAKLRRAPAGASASSPAPLAAWTGIGVAAVLFAVGHLPALALAADITPALVARTLALNLLGGMVYGGLFWRHHLESAIAAHAATHVGFAVLKLV